MATNEFIRYYFDHQGEDLFVARRKNPERMGRLFGPDEITRDECMMFEVQWLDDYSIEMVLASRRCYVDRPKGA